MLLFQSEKTTSSQHFQLGYAEQVIHVLKATFLGLLSNSLQKQKFILYTTINSQPILLFFPFLFKVVLLLPLVTAILLTATIF